MANLTDLFFLLHSKIFCFRVPKSYIVYSKSECMQEEEKKRAKRAISNLLRIVICGVIFEIGVISTNISIYMCSNLIYGGEI